MVKQANIRRRKRRYTVNQHTRSAQQDRAFEISEVISEPVENVDFLTSGNTANTVGAECNNEIHANGDNNDESSSVVENIIENEGEIV